MKPYKESHFIPIFRRLGLDSIHIQMIEQAPEAMVFADTHEIIKVWNKNAEFVLGYTSKEAVGECLAIIIPDRFLSRHQDG